MEQYSESEIYRYVIRLATQMGVKSGELFLSVKEGEIEGAMRILGEKQSFTGERNFDGSCVLVGQLKTRSSVFDYIASGRFDRESILLDLKYKYGTFRLTGRRIINDDAK